ncbi:MAG TPA: sigma 54-interacting transcriptional regulator [Anaeromyxobacteraceae bacterium]|jgi:two-component system response regulator FlrC
MTAAPARPPPLEATGTPVAASPAMREVLDAAEDVAATPTTVLLLGESGAGKELVARHIHARSGRPGPWVAVNCAALPAELLESELFGHERGAFTGASERRAGRFEQAHRGTLLLDEISELPLGLQAKILRVLQEREVDRVGGQRPVPVDARVVATTNRDLREMVRLGQFRSDLWYRLDVFPIVVPPLRERPEDLEPLAAALLAEAARRLDRAVPALDPAALEVLRRHRFPGNVRELRNLIERAVVRCRGPLVEARHLLLDARGAEAPGAGPADLPLELAALERIAIAEALRRVNGNRTHAARLLGIGLRTLRNKLRAARESGAPFEAVVPAAGQEWPAALAAKPAWSGGIAQARASQGGAA